MRSQQGAGKPSQTAIASAVQRALHLLWDAPPHIFYDPFAYPFAGSIADAVITGFAAALPGEVGSVARASFVVRHRWAEDELEKAVERGVRQYVILGAGLESFAWRRPELLARLRVFEIDHPSSQQWKRERVAALRLPGPEGLSFVPVDFEHDDLMGCLNGAGFEPTTVVELLLRERLREARAPLRLPQCGALRCARSDALLCGQARWAAAVRPSQLRVGRHVTGWQSKPSLAQEPRWTPWL